MAIFMRERCIDRTCTCVASKPCVRWGTHNIDRLTKKGPFIGYVGRSCALHVDSPLKKIIWEEGIMQLRQEERSRTF